MNIHDTGTYTGQPTKTHLHGRGSCNGNYGARVISHAQNPAGISDPHTLHRGHDVWRSASSLQQINHETAHPRSYRHNHLPDSRILPPAPSVSSDRRPGLVSTPCHKSPCLHCFRICLRPYLRHQKTAILHPIIAALAFIPTLYLYYNDSALVYLAFYVITSVMGVAVGWIIYLKK